MFDVRIFEDGKQIDYHPHGLHLESDPAVIAGDRGALISEIEERYPNADRATAVGEKGGRVLVKKVDGEWKRGYLYQAFKGGRVQDVLY